MSAMDAQAAGRGAELVTGGEPIGLGPQWLARAWSGGVRAVLDRLDRGLVRGSIAAILPDGSRRLLGGRAPGFDAEVTLRNPRALLRLATAGSVGWYQAWEAGEWSSPDPVPLFALFMDNGESLGNAGRARGPWRLLARMLHWFNRNTRAGALRNIHAHYDLGNDFYAAWLGETMTYSSALFSRAEPQPPVAGNPASELDMAQAAKIAAVLGRLDLSEGASVLEIGCGWGALAASAAMDFGARVDAISLSDEQLGWAREHWQIRRGSADFRKQDYRDVGGQYDAVMSVEMVEAVGREYWGDFLDCIARCLKPGGRAAIQYIAMRDELFEGYARSPDFIQTYIFPGGLLLREGEFRAMAQARGLAWRDQSSFGTDYAKTLRIWRARFDEAVVRGTLPPGFDERFVRLWRFYLMYCEGGFLGRGIDVSQVTLVRQG